MILVTGGTGFLGQYVVKELLRDGHQVRCLARRAAAARDLEELGAELAPGDVREPASVERAMAGVDKVVHLVAVIRERGTATFDAVNTKGTENVARAAGEAGVALLVHVSALGACANPRYPYAFSKWRGEQAVRQSRLPCVVLRPSVMFGDGFGFIDRLVQSLFMTPPLAPVPGTGRALFQPIWVVDVATCIRRVLSDTSFVGHEYDIGGPEHLTYEQVLDVVLEALDVWRVKVRIPLLLMKPAVRIMERILSDPPVTSVELAQLELDNVTDLDSVERHFGLRPTRLGDGLDYLRR